MNLQILYMVLSTVFLGYCSSSRFLYGADDPPPPVQASAATSPLQVMLDPEQQWLAIDNDGCSFHYAPGSGGSITLSCADPDVCLLHTAGVLYRAYVCVYDGTHYQGAADGPTAIPYPHPEDRTGKWYIPSAGLFDKIQSIPALASPSAFRDQIHREPGTGLNIHLYLKPPRRAANLPPLHVVGDLPIVFRATRPAVPAQSVTQPPVQPATHAKTADPQVAKAAAEALQEAAKVLAEAKQKAADTATAAKEASKQAGDCASKAKNAGDALASAKVANEIEQAALKDATSKYEDASADEKKSTEPLLKELDSRAKKAQTDFDTASVQQQAAGFEKDAADKNSRQAAVDSAVAADELQIAQATYDAAEKNAAKYAAPATASPKATKGEDDGVTYIDKQLPTPNDTNGEPLPPPTERMRTKVKKH